MTQKSFISAVIKFVLIVGLNVINVRKFGRKKKLKNQRNIGAGLANKLQITKNLALNKKEFYEVHPLTSIKTIS